MTTLSFHKPGLPWDSHGLRVIPCQSLANSFRGMSEKHVEGVLVFGVSQRAKNTVVLLNQNRMLWDSRDASGNLLQLKQNLKGRTTMNPFLMRPSLVMNAISEEHSKTCLVPSYTISSGHMRSKRLQVGHTPPIGLGSACTETTSEGTAMSPLGAAPRIGSVQTFNGVILQWGILGISHPFPRQIHANLWSFIKKSFSFLSTLW